MKRIVILCLILTLLLACVPTPTEEVVLNKTEGRLEAAITETTPVPAYETEQVELQTGEPETPQGSDQKPADEPRGTLRTAIGAPEHYTDAVENKVYGGTLTVQIDADVEIPNVSAVPVYTVRDRAFTPEEREHITKLLLGDGPYYNFNSALEEQMRVKRRIETLMKQLSDYNSRAYGEDYPYENYRKGIEMNLEYAQKHYAELPQPGSSQPWTGGFAAERVVVADARNRHVGISDTSIFFYDEFGSAPEPFGGHTPETAEQTEAMQMTEALFFDMTGEHFAATGVKGANEWLVKDHHISPEQLSQEDYSVNMAHTVAGIPCYPYSAFHGSDTAQQAAGFSQDYDSPMIPEHCDVLVQNGKVAAIQWYNAFAVAGTENENVALLPFDDVLNVFRQQIFRSIYLDPAEGNQPETVENMVVERIVLSYMRVKKKDAPNEQYLLPVWDFMGYTEDISKEWFANQSLLTINAIDGSIIDRNAGY